MKEFVDKLLGQNNKFLVLAGTILLLVAAGGGFAIDSKYALKITDPTWQTILGAVGLAFIAIGIILTWRESAGKSIKQLEDKPSNTDNGNLVQCPNSPEGNTQDEGLDINRPVIKWPPGQPSIEFMLASAKSNLLLLGTSLARAMNQDLFLYHKWLDANPSGRIGLLFLNPNSPHAGGRSRPGVARSSSDEIIHSLEIAYREGKQHNRFLPAIYEGPYRYSANASDIGLRKDEDESIINIITTSYTDGTSMGFNISLSSKTTHDAYEYYKTDLLNLWKIALANPPGHGISIVYRIDARPDPDAVQEVIHAFTSVLGKETSSLHIYSPEQYHITLSSVCRTQSQPFLPPLRIGGIISETNLPSHFGDFICDLIRATSNLPKRENVLVFDQLTLDETGQVRFEAKEEMRNEFVQSATALRETQIELFKKYSSMYPTEGWTLKTKPDSESRFHPRYETFLPHLTVGVAFDHKYGLPQRMKGQTRSMMLPKTFEFICGDVHVVHYAYRSLLRCIGELTVPSTEDLHISSDTILQELRIKPGN